jgi:hypothetical protein
MLSEMMKAEIALLPDEAAIAEVCAVLKRRRAEIMDARIAALPAFVMIEPIDGKGTPTEVTKQAAEQRLRSGTHKLVVTP